MDTGAYPEIFERDGLFSQKKNPSILKVFFSKRGRFDPSK
jgi:hypothetical protein